MNRDLTALANQFFDVLIVGGGILGAGIARDAALRGLTVALIDRGDFAAGTSSRSSKLIHGGFRYLEQRAFGLVAESCRERAVLQRIAPHLVRPLPFLMPVYAHDRHRLASIRAGMFLYDLFAGFPKATRHHAVPAIRTLMKEPELIRTGLTGSVLFHDCQEDDARFCLDNILDAAERGATVANYTELTGFVTREDRLIAARVRDRLGGANFEIAAHIFINATGPWGPRVAAFAPFDTGEVELQPTKGVHLLLPRLTQKHALAFQAHQDGRMLFILPWGDCSIVGTTDTDFDGDPANVRAEPPDVEYLLREVNTLLPGKAVTPAHIITTFAGVRALLRSRLSAPSARSREHRIVRAGQNLIHVAGGKYTTYRLIARDATHLAERMLGRSRSPCRTGVTPLRAHRPPPAGARIAEIPDVCESDIVYACAHEMAMKLDDVMRRRTSLALSRHGGPDVAERVAGIMAKQLGWNEARLRAEFQEYFSEWKRARP